MIFSKDATFVIVVFAITLLILVGVVSYIFFRSGRNRHAANDTVITFNNNHRKPHLILLMNDDSPPAGPRYPGFYYARNSLINSESKSFTSINISPSRPIVFGHEMDSEGLIRVVLTPPTPAKRERRKSLIDYEPESEEDLPAYTK